jgi:hypothetical protein
MLVVGTMQVEIYKRLLGEDYELFEPGALSALNVEASLNATDLAAGMEWVRNVIETHSPLRRHRTSP